MRSSITLLRSCLVLLILFTLSAERALQAQCTEAARSVYAGFTIGKGGWTPSRHPRKVADVNGDGLADIVGFSSTNTVVALSTGTGFASAQSWYSGFTIGKGGWTVASHPREVADVNGDGMADIVGFSSTNTVVALSTGEGFAAARSWYEGFTIGKGGWTPSRHPRRLADVNGDGMADIVGFSAGNTVVALSTGESFAPAQAWYNGFTIGKGGWTPSRHPRVVVDVNGDGMADIVGFSATNTLVALSTGESFAPAQTWYAGFTTGKGGWTVDKHPRKVADVNGDGMADIVGFSSSNTVVALSTGTSFAPARTFYEGFTIGKGGWAVDKHPRKMADVNGDGRADIVGFSGGNTLLAPSASCFELALTGPSSLVIFPDAVETLTYTCTLTNRGTGSGAEGWSYGVIAENATIKAIRFAETDAQTQFQNGFEKHEITAEGATASVALSFGDDQALAGNAPVSIAFVDVEVDFSRVTSDDLVMLSFVDLPNSFGLTVRNEVVEESVGQSPRVRPFVTVLEATPEFKRGDVNTDGTLSLTDPLMLFNHLFQNDPATLRCRDTADTDDSNEIDLTDGITILNYLFSGGEQPASPFPDCGIDPTDDEISCELYRPCD